LESKTAVNANNRRHFIFSFRCPVNRMFAFAALTMAVTMGCSGTMTGVIRRDAQRVQITYTDARVATAELFMVTPDGERFRGRSERFDRTEDMKRTDAEDISAHFEDLQTFNGNAQATLVGNRGNIIKCRFKITDFILGYGSGGFGICQMADGRVMDVFF
jgi:hypothetical protein